MTIDRVEFEVDNTLRIKERVVLVGVAQSKADMPKLLEYLDELKFLSTTANVNPIEVFYQLLEKPDSRFYVGSGKLKEIKE